MPRCPHPSFDTIAHIVRKNEEGDGFRPFIECYLTVRLVCKSCGTPMEFTREAAIRLENLPEGGHALYAKVIDPTAPKLVAPETDIELPTSS